MSAQRTDTIKINGKVYKLYCLPLAQYWEKYEPGISLFVLNPALTRMYYANWLMEDNKLYLSDFWSENWVLKKEYSLANLFPDEEKVFAEWYTGDLIIPFGRMVHYINLGWGATHEYRATIGIKEGLVISSNFAEI